MGDERTRTAQEGPCSTAPLEASAAPSAHTAGPCVRCTACEIDCEGGDPCRSCADAGRACYRALDHLDSWPTRRQVPITLLSDFSGWQDDGHQRVLNRLGLRGVDCERYWCSQHRRQDCF